MVLEWGNTFQAADDTNKIENKCLNTGQELVKVIEASTEQVTTSSSTISPVGDYPELEINWPEVAAFMVESLIIDGAVGGKIGLNKVGT